MINKTLYYISEETNPYQNLAVEEALMDMVKEGECILYLWQNRHTVVIGKNQNARMECKVDKLEEENGFLARRLSGGGAVFHDLGNLNFTFIMRKEDYDLERQVDVIAKAAQSFGIDVVKSGRNDILAEGRKFSGNAFYSNNVSSYHHGTIMLDVNPEMLPRYLNVSLDKLKSKGVDSVKSRVINLKELNSDISVEGMKEALLWAFEQVYGSKPNPIIRSDFDARKVAALTEKYASDEWKYGRVTECTCELSRRFEWGGNTLKFGVEEGRVKDMAIESDAMDSEFIITLAETLKETEFTKASMVEAILGTEAENELQETMKKDIAGLISESM